MTNTSREVGGVVGIALLGTVLFDRLGSTLLPKLAELGLTAGQASAVSQAASGFVSPAELAGLGLTPEQIGGFTTAFQESYMSGFHLALLIAALVLLTAAVVANRFIPGRAPRTRSTLRPQRRKRSPPPRSSGTAYHPARAGAADPRGRGRRRDRRGGDRLGRQDRGAPAGLRIEDHTLGLRSPSRTVPRHRAAVDAVRAEGRILGAYAPLGLIATLATWLALVLAGFTLIFWGRPRGGAPPSSLRIVPVHPGLHPPGRPGEHGADLRGGSDRVVPPRAASRISSIDAAFSRRRSGSRRSRSAAPPSAREMIWRFWRLGRLPEIHEVWAEWERWFVDVEESHTSHPTLAFFRSSHPDHSWITAAGAVLDGAALTLSSVDIPRDVKAEFCIRSGYLCLRAIADYFQIVHEPNPRPDDPISIGRDEWNAVIEDLEQAGVPLKPDRDQAWRDFAGWRVNYDRVLISSRPHGGADGPVVLRPRHGADASARLRADR